MASRGLKEVPPPGTRVQLTGYFLKATGQQRGGEGSKKWKVVACSCPLCSRGDFVAVDEPTSEEELRTTYADIPKADRAKHGILWRHINKANLQLVGKVPHSRDLADASELVAGKKSHHVSKKTGAQLDREIAQALTPTPEARRYVQTIQNREGFPEIISISMRPEGTNYTVKVPDAKNKLGYDLVDVLVHHSGARSINSASRSRTTPYTAGKIVTKYLNATR